MANNDKNNSLPSVNYGPGILLSALYVFSHLTGIFIRTDINKTVSIELHLFYTETVYNCFSLTF